MVGILLPVVASGVLAFTVYNVSTMQYALAVSINGEVLGYVRDQNVVESAKVLLRDRLKLAHNQTLSDWQLSPRFAIARAHSLTTAPQLVNNILTSGAENPGDLVSATAVYVGGELYAGTSEGARLKAYLDERLQRYAKDALPSAQVSYVNGVTCDPGTDDVFFAETVESFDEIVRRLNENLREAVMYTTPGNESLDIIAYTNGITLNDLLLRNPQLEGSDVASVPAMGTRLVIQREIPVLQVQVAVNETVMEDVPFAVERMDREDLAKGRVNTVQQGVNGIKEVVYKRVYVDGELDHSEVVSETIATPPVNQIDHVGTFVYNQLDPGSGGGGYIWPAPFAAYSSRGIFPGHRGVDINGEPDSPIYAANTGVVVNAGYHPSWGYNVVIEHEDGLSTLYAHCSILLVAEGQHVTRGDAIALMGSTGNSSGPHLHLEFFTTGDMWDLHDPMNFIVPPEGFDMSRW